MAAALSLLLLLLSVGQIQLAVSVNPVLIVSMDGFRWDYINNPTETPNFERFGREGVRVPYMNTSFPTNTFPNHYTMITGLYSESSGITENYMWDPVFNATFNLETTENRWWDGEPLWVTAKKHGLKTACYYWPGSSSEIQGIRPDIWYHYNRNPNYTVRVDRVVDWLANQEVKFATLYMPDPDWTGHRSGPDSPEMKAKVREMDGILGYLMDQLKENDLENKVNVIVTSDHGMTTVDRQNKVIGLSDHVNISLIERVPNWGTGMQILPRDGQLDTIVAALADVDHITVYKKDDIPDRFHYKDNRRIMPILIIPDEGWKIYVNKSEASLSLGGHGFDNDLMSMKPIFLARGPNLKKNHTADAINNVDIYPLICHLLHIRPAANNGSLDRTRDFVDLSPQPSAAAAMTSMKWLAWLYLAIFNLLKE